MKHPALRTPGSYQLVLRLDKPLVLTTGRLGEVELPAGIYVYTGSALSGLEARVGRHRRTAQGKTERLHWHIDRLLPHCDLIAVVEFPGTDRIECALNRSLGESIAVETPAPRFGSSDCRCRSHLAYLG